MTGPFAGNATAERLKASLSGFAGPYAIGLLNSVSGDFRTIVPCGTSGHNIDGTGVVKLVNPVQTLTDIKSDRRISAMLLTGQGTGMATVTVTVLVAPGVYQTFTIRQTNPNAVCTCLR